jgi:cutinase
MDTSTARILGALAATAGALPIALTDLPTAAAAPCPDVEVVFARGTTEPPCVGGVGQAFVESLRSQLGARSVGVYAVNYPASNDFETSSPAGAGDRSAIFSRWRRTARPRGWCSADTHRARR